MTINAIGVTDMQIGKWSLTAGIKSGSLYMAIARDLGMNTEAFAAWCILAMPSDNMSLFAGITKGKRDRHTFAMRSASFHNDKHGMRWRFSREYGA